MDTLLLIGTLLSPPRDPWPLRFAPVQATLMVDWSQTLWAAKHQRTEYNPLLGRHPSVGTINTYFALSTLTNAGYGLLPRKLRHVARALLLTQEVFVIVHNRAVGVQFASPF